MSDKEIDNRKNPSIIRIEILIDGPFYLHKCLLKFRFTNLL